MCYIFFNIILFKIFYIIFNNVLFNIYFYIYNLDNFLMMLLNLIYSLNCHVLNFSPPLKDADFWNHCSPKIVIELKAHGNLPNRLFSQIDISF